MRTFDYAEGYMEKIRMNLPQFLKRVDAGVSDMTREQLESYIHELARILPENRRDDFLQTMQSVKEETDFASKASDKEEYSGLYSEIEKTMEILEKINAGDRCLDSEYNEEWDDWYNSDKDEILFSDPERLLPDVEDSLALIHKCTDMEAYKEGCELAELLSALEVFATGDYNDYDGSPLGIKKLYEHRLIHGPYEELVREALFLAYMGNELSYRAEELYCMMINFQYFNVKLEDIMKIGSHDLPEFKEFLPLWIDYLGNQTGRGVKKLLQEAQAMIEDENQLLNMARKFVDKHPELYRQILQKGLEREENGEMFRIGMEALEKLPVSYIIRSEIALLTAEYACKMNESTASEFCWLEAFRSDTSVVNYLRIRLLSRDWKQYEKQVKQIYNEAYERTKKRSNANPAYYDGNAQRENTLYRDAYCAILFFEGDFECVLKEGMSEKKALGWSSTFMKEGLAMFLLLLSEGETLPSGLNAMLARAISGCGFRSGEFLNGTCLNEGTSDRELFWNLFCKWKAGVNVSEEDDAKWMKKMEQLISMRTAGIMEENRRNYYGECAAFIAAYGEVLESRGEKNAKAHIMENYKGEYFRRRAFHQELRAFGMKK